MDPLPQMAFSHIGLYVTDMESMVDFYTGVLGFSVTDRARIRGRDVVFLSRSPEEHHQIVLVPGRAAESASTVNQISFRVTSLAELRRLHAKLIGLGASGLDPTNHGGSWSVYFSDPEGNRIELLAQTPWYAPPVSIPLDLSLSDAEIHGLTEAMVEQTPGHMPRSQWREQLERRLHEEGTIERRPGPSDEAPQGIHRFMQGYKDAWEQRNEASFAALFVADGEYANTPFAVQRGHAQLAEYWRRVKLQEDVELTYEVLAASAESGIAHWHVTYQVASEELFHIWAKSTGTNLIARRPGDPLPRMVLDGVLKAEFESDGLCKTCRIWWHSMPQAA